MKPQRKEQDSIVAKFDAARRARPELYYAFQRASGTLNLEHVRWTPSLWGALAELEADGIVEPVKDAMAYRLTGKKFDKPAS